MMDPDEELAAYKRDAKAGRIPGIPAEPHAAAPSPTPAAMLVSRLESHLDDLKHEAEAREGQG